MKLLIALLALPLVGQTSGSYSAEYHDCTIVARRVVENSVEKWFHCREGVIELRGQFERKIDIHGFKYVAEYGDMWFGEIVNFGLPQESSQVYRDCETVAPEQKDSEWRSVGGEANFDGYMSFARTFYCKRHFLLEQQSTVRLVGKWGEEIQGHWDYHLELGEPHMEPEWVDDRFIDNFVVHSDSQKWCKTTIGWKLCGDIPYTKVDHGIPPPYRIGAGPSK